MYVIRHDNEIINVRTLYLFKPDYVFQNDLTLVGQMYFRGIESPPPTMSHKIFALSAMHMVMKYAPALL